MTLLPEIENKLIAILNTWAHPDDRQVLSEQLIPLIELSNLKVIERVEQKIDERKGWNGYAVVDPETDYCNDQFFLHKATAVACKKKLQSSGWGKLKILEIEILPIQTLCDLRATLEITK